MNIIFGVAGEGFGHISRAKVIIKYLESKGHTVKILTYHQGVKKLAPDFDVKKIFGLRFSHKKNQVNYTATFLNNVKQTPRAVKSIIDTKKLIDQFKPNVILTDFEPISAVCAQLCKIPLISIDNQHAITNGKLSYNQKYQLDYYYEYLGVSTMAANADAYIITSFFDFETTRDNTFLVPPILRDEIIYGTPTNKGHILVYGTVSNTAKTLQLPRNNHEKFIIYGREKKKSKNNCIFKKFNTEEFLEDLLSAKAVIGSAGATLIAESIYLNKPYLAIPIKKRFEQSLNAYYLKNLGYGDYSEKLTSQDLNNFIANIPLYNQNLKKYQRSDNSQLYKLLDKLLTKLSI